VDVRRPPGTSVLLVKVGIASRPGKASKKGPRTVGRDHRSSSSEARSLVADDSQGQQLAGGSSVETSLLEESESLAARDVDKSSQHRKHARASRVGELSDRRHRSKVGNKNRVRRSRSLTADNDARTFRCREADASPGSQNDKVYDPAVKSSAPLGRGTSACATGSKAGRLLLATGPDVGHGGRSSAPSSRAVSQPIVVTPPLVGGNKRIWVALVRLDLSPPPLVGYRTGCQSGQVR